MQSYCKDVGCALEFKLNGDPQKDLPFNTFVDWSRQCIVILYTIFSPVSLLYVCMKEGLSKGCGVTKIIVISVLCETNGYFLLLCV